MRQSRKQSLCADAHSDKIVTGSDQLIAEQHHCRDVCRTATCVADVHIMKLLEIVRGEDTTPQMLGVTLKVSKLLKKIGVVVNDGFGLSVTE